MYILLGILFELMQQPKVTATQLSEKYEISKRSVYRYVDALSLSGIPVTTTAGRYGGISLVQKSVFDKSFFTKEELDKLLSLLQIESNMDTKVLVAKLRSLKED